MPIFGTKKPKKPKCDDSKILQKLSNYIDNLNSEEIMKYLDTCERKDTRQKDYITGLEKIINKNNEVKSKINETMQELNKEQEKRKEAEKQKQESANLLLKCEMNKKQKLPDNNKTQYGTLPATQTAAPKKSPPKPKPKPKFIQINNKFEMIPSRAPPLNPNLQKQKEFLAKATTRQSTPKNTPLSNYSKMPYMGTPASQGKLKPIGNYIEMPSRR